MEKGEAAVKDLESRNLPGSVELLQLDVSDEESIKAAAKTVEAKHGRYSAQVSSYPTKHLLTALARLDALVNNAAVGSRPGTFFTGLLDALRTNVAGPGAVVLAFEPLLAKSITTPRIINVTSGAGSISLRLDPNNPYYAMKTEQYRVSKAALNMLSACQSVEYGPRGWKVFLFCPGFTVSNLGPMNTAENGAQPTSEGARPMVGILDGERDAEHGGYLKADGHWNW